jgi:hypothetical protein
MSEANDRQSEFIAKSAFLLMIGGVLVPLILALLVFLLPGANVNGTTAINVGLPVAGFAFLLEILALVLGIVCRQHLFGKVAMMGAGTVIILDVLVPALFLGLVSRTYSASQPTVTPSAVSDIETTPRTTTTITPNTEIKPKPSVTPKPETSTDSLPHTLILGKWRAANPNQEHIWEFTKEGVVNCTVTMTGTNIVPGGTPITLPGGTPVIIGSVTQSGKFRFVNDKMIHLDMKEAHAGILTAPESQTDWNIGMITPTVMRVQPKGQTTELTFERVK